jgi:hypothetical protein
MDDLPVVTPMKYNVGRAASTYSLGPILDFLRFYFDMAAKRRKKHKIKFQGV